jgi:hypothetical protein
VARQERRAHLRGGRGQLGTAHGWGGYSGSYSHVARVSLCRACAKERDDADDASRRRWNIAAWILLPPIVLVILVCLGFFLFLILASL